MRGMWFSMSEIVLEKLKNVCPKKRLSSMYMVDVEEETLKAFQEIGYKPSKTIKKAIDKAWVNSDRNDPLYQYVHKVWGYDNG